MRFLMQCDTLQFSVNFQSHSHNRSFFRNKRAMPCSLRGCQRTPKGSSEVEVSAGWGLFHDSLDDLWPEFAKRPRKGGFTGPSRVHTTQIQVTVRVSFPRVARLTSTELLPPSTTMNRHDVRCSPEVNARRINLRTGMPSEMSYSFISFLS